MAGGKKGLVKGGMSFVSQKRNKGKAKKASNEYDDDVDTFMKGKSKVSLNRDRDEFSEEEVDTIGFNGLDSDEEEEEEGDELEGVEEGEEDGEEEGDGFEDEEEGEEDEEEDAELSRWGKNKKTFYSTDNIEEMLESEEEEEMNEEEEKEALRLQKKQAATLSASDFDDDAAMFGDRLKKAANGKDVKKNEKKVKPVQVVEQDEEEVETLKKDLSKLSTSQKLEIISRESPELLNFLDDFKKMIEELRTKLAPILSKVKGGELPTSKGVSFLEVKYHLLLSYCTQIVYYMLLKAQGKSVKDHPVIMQLVRIRTIMERMKPLDLKLKNQIDKLLKVASMGHLEADDDPRRFKPRLQDMENPEEEEEEEESTAGKSSKVYKPPQISSTPFEESGNAKSRSKLRNEQRLLEKVGRSKLMRDIGEEFSEAPQEKPNLGAKPKMSGSRDKEIVDYEEENMVRLDLGKKQKNKSKKERFEDDLNVFDEFAPLAKLNEMRGNTEDSRAVLQRKQMRDILSDKKRKIEDDDEEDDFYKEIQQQQLEKKKQKSEPKRVEEEEEEEEEAGRRGISNKIESNRGLTKSRNKDKKHSRTKLRGKYEKATTKRNSQVKQLASQHKPFSGESSGIKASTVKSRKLY